MYALLHSHGQALQGGLKCEDADGLEEMIVSL